MNNNSPLKMNDEIEAFQSCSVNKAKSVAFILLILDL